MKFACFSVENKQKCLQFQIKSILLRRKTNKTMDIRARIEQVIDEKGLTKRLVAERMGKFSQAFNSLLTNPKWETIELVASAIGISTCEMLYGIKQEAEPQTEQPAVKPEPSPVDELPFGDNKDTAAQTEPEKAEEVRIIRFAYDCPHCGKSIRISIEESEKN